jgi:hypothetical protein
VSNISLITDFVEENSSVAGEPVCDSKLVACLINSQEVSINCPHLDPCGPRVVKQV